MLSVEWVTDQVRASQSLGGAAKGALALALSLLLLAGVAYLDGVRRTMSPDGAACGAGSAEAMAAIERLRGWWSREVVAEEEEEDGTTMMLWLNWQCMYTYMRAVYAWNLSVRIYKMKMSS